MVSMGWLAPRILQKWEGGGGVFVMGSVGEVGVFQDAPLSHPATARPLPPSPSLHRPHSLSDSLLFLCF